MENLSTKSFKQIDIDNYITFSVEESINLDFKRGDALKIEDKVKNEIAKDVSSFANSDGGIIVYGIEEKNYKAANLIFVDGNLITKEWLEQIINSRIHRKIEGLVIEAIRYNENISTSIYVVKIPRSINAPHMTSNKRFYKRYNFQSVEMEEYEIRNLYLRKDKTELDIIDPILTLTVGGTSAGRPVNFYTILNINIINKGETIEKLYKTEIRIPNGLTSGIHSSFGNPYIKYFVRNEDGYAIYSVPNTSPLFQHEITVLEMVKLDLNTRNFEELKNKPIIIRLMYSNGTVEKSILLYDHLSYNGTKITSDILRNS